MGRVCEICGKGTSVGNNVPRKGLFKKKGGTGSNIGVKTKRTFRANIHSKYVVLDGVRKKRSLCTRCMRTLVKN